MYLQHGDFQQYYDELRLKLAWRVSIAITVIFSFLSVFYINISIYSFLSQFLAAVAAMMSMLVLYLTKNYKFSFLLFGTAGLSICANSLLFHHQAIHYAEFLWLIASVAIIYFSFGKKMGLLFLSLAITIVILFILLSLNTHINQSIERTPLQNVVLVIELILGFSFNVYLLEMFIKVQTFANQRLQELNAQLIGQNAKITQQNKENTTLVKEIHHRVKNNLQIIVSLLRIQKNKIENEEERTTFQEAINKIMAMALIHQKLYQNEHLSSIEFEAYAYELMTTIVGSTHKKDEIQLSVQADVHYVSLESLIPIGLIINELTSNSIKHAFVDLKEKAQISLTAKYAKAGNTDKIELQYWDNGQWKSPENNEHLESSFGLSLIEDLTHQLDGSMTIEKSTEGTKFVFFLKNKKEAVH